MLPRVVVQYGERLVIALVDTGATHGFVRESCYQGTRVRDFQTVNLATGEGTVAYGPVLVEFAIDGYEMSRLMYVVPELMEEMILGVDWLEEEQAVVDVLHGTVYFGSDRRQVAYFHRAQQKCGLYPAVDMQDARVPPGERESYQRAFDDFPDVFYGGMQQPTTTLAQHVIQLKDSTPFKIRRYQYSPSKKNIIREEVTKMLAPG